MALLHVEKIQKYNAEVDIGLGTNDSNDVVNWAFTDGGDTGVRAGLGRFGERALHIDNVARHLDIPFATVTSNTTIIVGMSLYFFGYAELAPAGTDAPTSHMSFLSLVSAAGGTTMHWGISVTPGGGLVFHNAGTEGAAAPVIGRVDGVLNLRTWHYLEVKATMANAASGSLTVKLDGATIFTDTASDFLNGAAALGFLKLLGMSNELLTDQIIVCDGAGSAPFNNFFGDIRLEQQLPDADGATVQWTQGPTPSGSNFQRIDDALPLASASFDTDYLEEGTTDEINLASHAAFSMTNATSILFTKLEALARSDTTGDKIAMVVRSGGTDFAGADILLDGTTVTAYRWRYRYDVVDPNTAAAWTLSNINAAEWGVKKRV